MQESVSLVASWLDSVDLETATDRIADAHAWNRAKDADGPTWNSLASSTGDLSRISLHEASHAVVGYSLGANVSRACMRADGSGAVDGVAADPVSRIVTTLAGIFGELLFCETDRYREYSLGRSTDILTARQRIAEMEVFAPTWEPTNKAFAIMSCCTVLSNRVAILRVAGALVYCGELDGAAIAALCGRLQ